jgi:hypothetical protein
MSPTRESYSTRYFAQLYSPASQHVVLEALFGIEHEVSESLRPGIDHQVAHSRLQWWREECERTADGHPVHPLTRTLVYRYSVVSQALSMPQCGTSLARPSRAAENWLRIASGGRQQ